MTKIIKKVALVMSMNTFSSIFQWLSMPIIDMLDWLDYLPKAGESNG